MVTPTLANHPLNPTAEWKSSRKWQGMNTGFPGNGTPPPSNRYSNSQLAAMDISAPKRFL